MARAGEVLAAPGRLAFWGSHALTPGHIEPRRGRAIKAWGGGFRGIFPSLPQQAKHAAGEDFRQLLAALGGGQVGRHGGSSWFLDCDAHASPIRLSMPAEERIVRGLDRFSKSVGQRRHDCRRSSSLPIRPREASAAGKLLRKTDGHSRVLWRDIACMVCGTYKTRTQSGGNCCKSLAGNGFFVRLMAWRLSDMPPKTAS